MIPKQHGKFAIVEWEKKPMEMGPSESHRIDKAEVIEIVESCGFVLNNRMEFAEVFYGIDLTQQQHSLNYQSARIG